MSLLIEILTLLTLQPAAVLFAWARLAAVTTAVGSLPLVVQVPAILLVADFTQYWVHRTFHHVPVLWRFHAIHHSIERMDWLAGSRLHLVDVVVTRGLTYVPIFVLGFPQAPDCLCVSRRCAGDVYPCQRAVGVPRAPRFIATPAFHHWHHSAERERRPEFRCAYADLGPAVRHVRPDLVSPITCGLCPRIVRRT